MPDLVLCQEGVDHAPLPRPGRASGAVEVDPELPGGLIVDDAGDPLHIHPPGHLVRAHQHSCGFFPTTIITATAVFAVFAVFAAARKVGQDLLSPPTTNGAGDFLDGEVAQSSQQQKQSTNKQTNKQIDK